MATRNRHKLKCIQTTDADGKSLFILMDLAPHERQFLDAYRKLPDERKGAFHAVLFGLSAHVLSHRQLISMIKTRDPFAAVLEWCKTTTPAQRGAIEANARSAMTA